MKQPYFLSTSTRRILQLLLSVAVLTVVACDNEVSYSPTAPDWPTSISGAGSERSLQISGRLTAEEGACLMATVLYDGQELAGARARCPQASGCATLELAATVRTTVGHHTVSFQVLDQSPEAVAYLAEGSVVADRDDVSLGGVSVELGPRRATLQRGGFVSFDLQFRD